MENKKLKKTDIVNYCNKLGIRIDNNILETCDSDTIVELYISLLEKASLLKNESLSIEFSALNKQIFQFTGLHDKIIRKLKLFRFLRTFLTTICNYTTFTSADIFNPSPSTTQTVLSHIIAFTKHFFHTKEKFTSLKALYLQTQSNLNDASKLHCEAQTLLNNELKAIDDAKPEIERLSSEIAMFQNQNANLKTQIISSEQDITEKKVTLADIEKKIELVDDMYKNCSDKMNMLKTQIVSSSSEELGIVITEKENAIKNLNKEIEEKNAIIKKLTNVENCFDSIEQLINEYNTHAENADNLVNEEEQAIKKFDNKKEVLTSKTKMLEENKSTVNILIQQSETLDNYLLTKLNKDKEKKEQELQELITKYNEINSNKEQIVSECEQYNNNIHKIQNDFLELESIKQLVENQVLQEMDDMYKAASDYCENFKKLLTQHEQANQEQSTSL
jgi:chromosome segregation ATPase